jgi:ribosomal protein L16 Arg81 hydroxylase
MEALLQTVESLKAQIEALSKKFEEQKKVVKKVDKRALIEAKKKLQEEFVKDLLKDDYEITNDENDRVTCAELSRYLAIKSDKYSPRVLDNTLGRMLKTTTMRDRKTNSKMKIGIKRVQCEIQD